MRAYYLPLFLLYFFFGFFPSKITSAAINTNATIPLLHGQSFETKKECDSLLKVLDDGNPEERARNYIDNQEQFLNCYQAFRGDRLWRAYGMLGLAYHVSERPIEAMPYLENAFLHIPGEATLSHDDKVYRIDLILGLVATFGVQKNFDRALQLIKKEFPTVIELLPSAPIASFLSGGGWAYANLHEPGPGIFYAKLVAAGDYAEGENAAEDQDWKNDLTRYLTRFKRTDEITLFDKLPAGPSPDDISPFSPARVLMVGPEIALFDRFERLAVALQQAAASGDPAALQAARENMRAWMDDVERGLK